MKQARLKGKSGKEVLIYAGLSKKTASHEVGRNATLKYVDAEIVNELKQADVTVQLVISRLNEDRELAKKKWDIATMTRVDELLGKYIAMFKDILKAEVDIKLTPDEQSELEGIRKHLIPQAN